MKKKVFIFLFLIQVAFLTNAQMTEKWLTDEESVNGNENGVDLATDASGNIYVVGKKDNGTNFDIYLLKYNSSGTKQWYRTIDGGDDDIPVGIEIDASNNIYIGGNTVVSGVNKLTAAMYNSSGTLQWQYTSVAAYETKVYAIDLNGTSLHLAGYSKPTTTNTNAFFVKLSSTGTLTWAQSYDNLSSDIANDIKVRATTGDVYATGTTGTSAFTLKLNSSGTQQWAQTYSNASGMAIAIGGLTTSFAVYMTGTVSGDGLTVKYNDSGVQQWSETVPNGTTYNYIGTDIVFYSNAIYVAIKSDHVDANSMVYKYNTSGTVQWTYDSPAKNEIGLLINGGYLYASIWYHSKVVRLNMTTGDDDLYYSWGEFHNAVGSGMRIYSMIAGSNNDILITGYHKESADPYDKICLLDICTPTFAVEITSSAGAYSCENYPFSISATSGSSSYEWSFYSQYTTYLPYVNIDNPNVQSTNALITNAFPESSGLYLLVEALDAYGCPDYDSTLMVVRPQPNLSATGNNVIEEGGYSACVGESIEMHTHYIYQMTDWYHNGVWFDYSMWGESIYVTESGSYYAIVFNEYSCSDTTETDVLTFYSTPSIELGSNIGSCTGQTVTLDAGSGFTYLWSTGSTAQTIDVTTDGSYSVTISNSGGCTATDNISVAFNAVPVIELGTDQSSCTGQTVSLNAGTAASYLWSNSATTQTINVTSTGTYSVTITDANGCTNSDNVSVTFNSNPVINLGSDISICGTSGATLDAGSGMTSYSWSSGQTSQTISPAASGTYSVTVTNSDGCSASDNAVVTYNTIPSIELGADQNACVGQTLTLNAGSASSYLWSNTATTQTINVTTSGTYAVTITAANGCTNSDNVSVTFNSNPVVNLGSDISICGTSGATLDAGSGMTSYNWSSGQTSQTISPAASGTYSVTVTNSNGCSASDNAVVTYNTIPSIELGAAQNKCVGETVTLNAGTASSYLWSNSATTQTINVTTSGTYAVTITAANGCTNTDNVSVTFHSNPVVNLGSDINVCEGTGVTLDAGSASSYLWSNGSSSQTISPVTSGSFSVTVTDANGCEGSDLILVTINEIPEVNLGPDFTACTGSTVVLDAEAGADSYLWSDASTSQTLSVNVAGTYSVTVTTNGCSSTDVVVADFEDNISINLGADIFSCVGETISVDAGSGFDTYLWSTGSTAQSITAAVNGTYSVTVTSGSCPGASDAINVTFNNLPVIDLEDVVESCVSANIDAGAGFIDYLWSTTETSQTIDVFTGGIFSVTVTDGNGCQNYDEVTVTIHDNPVVSLGPDAGGCGSVVLNEGSGITENSYIWSTGETTPLIEVYTSDTYTITVTNVHGCTGTDNIFATVFEVFTLGSTVTDATCGNNDGSAIVNVTGGTPGFEYLWSTGETTAVAGGLAAGEYSVVVTDANGCTNNLEITISNTNAPVLTMSQSAVLCFGECNGTASANATGGTAPYTYLWSNSEETDEITGLCAGTYMVTITDDNGCEVLDSVEISQPEILSATFEVTDDLMSTGTAEGAIVTTVTGGTGTYTYLWDGGETTAELSELEPGYYTVTITDENGCTYIEEVYVDGIIDNISGIENAEGMKVFPNPSTDGIFNVATPYEINRVEIFNLIGEKIRVIESFDRIIDLSGNTKGVYMANVFTTNGKVIAHKLVVK